MSLLGVLLVIFIVLKLVGTIDWSWWLVLMPLWIGIALTVALGALAGLVAAVAGINLGPSRFRRKRYSREQRERGIR